MLVIPGERLTKHITLVLILSISILTLGCLEGATQKSEEQIKQEIEVELAAVIGTQESFDTDGDSVEDKYTLTYEPEEVADDLFLKKKVEYYKTLSGFEGNIKIEFENKGETREFTHVELIPKSFAQSIDDLDFSLPPNKIINPDPEVEWNFKFKKGTVTVIGIEIKAAGKAPVVEVFDEFDKVKGFGICDKLPPETKEMCYMIAVAKLKNPKPADCDIISGYETRENCYAGVAMIREDINICANYIKDQSIKAQCYTFLAAAKNDKTICEKITEKGERTVCELIVEAEEKGTTFEELYKQKLKEREGKERDLSEDIYFDILISPDDDERVTGETYTFEAALDPPDLIPKNPRYEFIFEDGHAVNSSSNTIERKFKDPGRYQFTVTLYDLSTGKVVKKKIDCIDLIKGEGEEEKEEEITGLTTEQCKEKADQCIDECNKICEQTKYDYCREFEYSGCALDVFCWCNACGHVYNPRWCRYSEYIGCAEGALATFRGCIDGCNAKRRAAQDVSTCWNDCNDELFTQLGNPCKDEPCLDFCQDKDFDLGVWAKYTAKYSWDSCACSNAN